MFCVMFTLLFYPCTEKNNSQAVLNMVETTNTLASTDFISLGQVFRKCFNCCALAIRTVTNT